MRKLFTFLFAAILIILCLKTKAQDVSIEKNISGTNYSSLTLNSNFNVNSNKDFIFRVKVQETNIWNFAVGTKKLYLEIPNGFTFEDYISTNYLKHSEPGNPTPKDLGSFIGDPDTTITPSKVYLMRSIPVNYAATLDDITISLIKIHTPSEIAPGDYAFRLIDSTITATTKTAVITNLLTLRYDTPVLSITKRTATKACFDAAAYCDFTIADPNDEIKYNLFENDVQAVYTGGALVYITGDLNNKPLNYGDKYFVKDEDNTDAYGKSNEITIKGNDYFKRVMLSGTEDVICEGESIRFSLDKDHCTLPYFNYELEFKDNNGGIFESIGTFTDPMDYTPAEEGSFRVKITKTLGIHELVEYTDTFILKEILTFEEITLNQGIQVPKSFGRIQLESKLTPDSTYNQSTLLRIPGIYEGKPDANLWYLTKDYAAGSDYTFGRFHFARNDEDFTQDTTFFDTKAEGVTTGASAKNKVFFHYGKYFHTSKKYCFSHTETDINVIVNDIFVQQESFCSYDDSAHTVEIDVTKLPRPANEDLNGYTAVVSYKGYEIKSNGKTQKGTDSIFTFKPSEFFDGSAACLVDITAQINVRLYKPAAPCAVPWDINHGEIQPIYTVGNKVSYINNEYICRHDADRTKIPGRDTYYWELMRECTFVWINEPCPPGEPCGFEEYQTLNQSSPNGDPELVKGPIGPGGGYKEYHCQYEPWTSIGHPSPIYRAIDHEQVTYNAKIYECVRDAYTDDRPGSSTCWNYIKDCDMGGGESTQISYTYATASFYIYKPKTDARFLNLASKYCPSKDSILLQSNYIINSVTGEGISEKSKNYYYSYGKAYDKGYIKDTLVLNYTDNNGCIAANRHPIEIKTDTIVDKSGILYWSNGGKFNALDTTYCLGSYPFQLATTSNYKVDTITGSGVYFENNNYFFNPDSVVFNPDTTLQLQYIDKSTGCPYSYNRHLQLAPEFVDSSADLILLKEKYCAIDSSYEIKLSNTHTVESVAPGTGLNYASKKLTYNPFRAINSINSNARDSLYRKNETFDFLTVHLLDSKNCPYEKKDTVSISNANGNIAGLESFSTQYCAQDKEYKLNASNSHKIDSITGEGIINYDKNLVKDSVYYNPFNVLTRSNFYNNYSKSHVVSAYLKDLNNCVYKKDYPVEVSTSLANPSEITSINPKYCAIDKEFKINAPLKHTIDSINGIGIIVYDVDMVKDSAFYNPFNVINPNNNSRADLYNGNTKSDNVTVYLKDAQNCLYKKNYNTDVTGNLANPLDVTSINPRYCAVDKEFKISAPNKDYSIDSINGIGINVYDLNIEIDSAYYNPFSVINPKNNSRADLYNGNTKSDNVTVYLKDAQNCLYKKNYNIDVSGNLANPADLISLKSRYCADTAEFKISAAFNHKIDSIKGDGILIHDKSLFLDSVAYSPFNVLNPNNTSRDDLYNGIVKDDLVRVYLRDTNNCVYQKDYPIKVSGSFGDSYGLKIPKADYCAVNNDFEIEGLKGFSIDSVDGSGIYWNNADIINYNPFRALSSTNYLDYTSAELTDNVTIHFRDNNNCSYKTEWEVDISGNTADISGGLINLSNSYCKFDERVQLLSPQLIDSIDARGIYKDGNNWFLDPKAVTFTSNNDNEHVDVRYYYKDRNDCAWFKDYEFDVFARPHAGFDVDLSTICYQDFTAFSDTSIFEADGSIVTREWDFGNGLKLINPLGVSQIPDNEHEGQTRGTYINPQHKYKNHGVYTASLKVTSDKGCMHSASKTVIVGDYPKIEFSYDGKIHTDATLFSNKTTTPIYDPVINYSWDFDDSMAANDTRESTVIQDESYTFAGTGVHNVHLRAVSKNDCVSEDSIKVPIFPYIVVNNNSNYLESFTNQETGWLPAHSYGKGLPSGWKLAPVQAPYSVYPNTDGTMWLTGDSIDNIFNEDSWVESPCFELSGLDFPLLTMNIFQSIEGKRDGAVVQYSLDDGDSWELLSNGINKIGQNWYNETGIVSNPGNQTNTGNIGWSKDNKIWETTRFPLDMVKADAGIANARCVRFRVAYSSDAGNAEGQNLKGFAFDNFTLSSRNRIVMIEQFVNTVNNKSLQESEEAWLTNIIDQNKPEVVDIRYHNYISHDIDPLYTINTADISARSFEYGAWRAQLTMVDGIHRCLAPAEEEVRDSYNERTLKDKRFDINVSTKKVGESLVITANITKLTDTLITKPGTQKCAVRMAIVQKEFNYQGEIFKNILIELLPDGDGNVVASIPADFPKGDSIVATGSWTPKVTTIGNKFRLVVYVQGVWGIDEIHQAWFTDLDDSLVPQFQGWPLGFDDPEREIGELSIYPMPAKDKLTIQWAEELKAPVNWKITSISGTVAKEGLMDSGKIKEVIKLDGLNDGLYLLVMEDMKNSRSQKRKIIVIK